jgi:hypothetical protein
MVEGKTIHGICHRGVVQEGDLKEPYRFLGAVARDGVLAGARTPERIQIRHVPDGRLRPVAAPLARAPFRTAYQAGSCAQW